MKPEDVKISLLDFFAILLPGAIVTWLLLLALPPPPEPIPAIFGGAPGDSPSWVWGAFALLSYLVGHLVFHVGSVLDRLYDLWRRRAHPPESDGNFFAARDLAKSTLPDAFHGAYSPLKWCRVYLRLHAPGLADEVDELEASQKLFRGLVVVAALLVAQSIGPEVMLGLALTLLAAPIAGIAPYRRPRKPRTSEKAQTEPQAAPKADGGEERGNGRPKVVATGLGLALVVALTVGLRNDWPGAAQFGAGILFGGAAFARYCDLRWKMTEHAYVSALTVNATPKKAEDSRSSC